MRIIYDKMKGAITLQAESQEDRDILLDIWESEGLVMGEMDGNSEALHFRLGDKTRKGNE